MAHEFTLLGRDALALGSAVARFWPRIERITTVELERWRRHAVAIPDATLRRQALDKLDSQRANALAAATFATLVTRRQRPHAARLMVTLQVMYDYLDAVSEEAVDDPLRDGRQLHRSLTGIFDQVPQHVDYYAHHPHRDDGGYLALLTTTCRAIFERLPSSDAVRGAALTAAGRCGESQTRTHAVAAIGTEQLAEWSATHAAADGYHWWELAAGAASSLTVHALIALAANPEVTPVDVARVDAVYYPAISALSTLLDSLADDSTDDPDADHRYVAYYPSVSAAVTRLAEIAAAGATAARCLSDGPRHVVIVAGIACFYLVGPQASGGLAQAAAPQILAEVGPIRRPITAVLRSLRIRHGEPA